MSFTLVNKTLLYISRKSEKYFHFFSRLEILFQCMHYNAFENLMIYNVKSVFREFEFQFTSYFYVPPC